MKEIRVDQQGKVITYVRYEPLYHDDMLLLFKNLGFIHKHLIHSHIKFYDIESFLLKTFEFEKSNAYDYSNQKQSKKIKGTDRKTIYLSSIEMLLPVAVNTKTQKIKLVNAYIKKILADLRMFYLNYFAYEYTKGKATYIKIIISERAYINKTFKKRYNRDYVKTRWNEDGNKEKYIAHKKGDVMKNKDGKPIEEHITFGKKLRLFNDSNFMRLINRCKESLVAAYKNITQVNLVQNLRFKKVRAYPKMNKYTRKVIYIINQCKYYIESHLNHIYQQLHTTERDDLWHFSEERILYEKVMHLYHEMATIFESNKIIDQGVCYGVNYKYLQIPEIEMAIELIKQQFHEKFSKI